MSVPLLTAFATFVTSPITPSTRLAPTLALWLVHKQARHIVHRAYPCVYRVSRLAFGQTLYEESCPLAAWH
jgi:hypothetical protein